ncbi:MAG: hypothetical protein IJE05_01305 [Clostridia bacterium]|nr:hypothetical protein [Clostridia bacterium]
MKVKSFIVIILIIVINIIFFNINKVQASGVSDIIKGGDNFIAAGKKDSVTVDETQLEYASSSIYNILLVIGMCAAVIISGILGIKFMIGSVEEKAQIKDALVPFVIGCVVIFGAFGIWKIFVTYGNNLGGESSSGVSSDHVKEEDGKVYVKGQLYCGNCEHEVSDIAFKNGRCSECKRDFDKKCKNCGKELSETSFLNERCSDCKQSITDNPFKFYK